MSTYVMMLLVVSVSLQFLLVSSAPATRDCDAYAYCNGQNFPMDFQLGSRPIKCDTAPTPRDRCCLPQAKHFVCYGITVDGQYLNYDVNDNAKSTDFTGLCNAMARARGKTTGKHSSAVTAVGGGLLVWRYGEFTTVDAGAYHIKNLACEITS